MSVCFCCLFRMGFFRVWVSCAWVWCCDGLLCQVLAKKGEKGFVAQMFRQGLVLTNVIQTCRIKCSIMYLFGSVFCDLWSELWTQLWPVFRVTRSGGGFGLKFPLMLFKEYLRILLFHHWSSCKEEVPGLRGSASCLLLSSSSCAPTNFRTFLPFILKLLVNGADAMEFF